MTGLLSPLLAFLFGCLHFFVLFACLFNGHPRATAVVILAYFATGLVLERDHPDAYRMHLVFYLAPAVPLTGLFFVGLLGEVEPRSALQWLAILLAAVVLALSGGLAGAFSQGRRRGEARRRDR